jgi:hypothetical protein
MAEARKFQPKRVVIEAMQNVGGDSARDIFTWVQLHDGEVYLDSEEWAGIKHWRVQVRCVDGQRRDAREGDWIVRGINGDFYPCTSAEFDRMYQVLKVELSHEQEMLEVIDERDKAEEWADKLAHAIGNGAEGEHSNLNNPWENALRIMAIKTGLLEAHVPPASLESLAMSDDATSDCPWEWQHEFFSKERDGCPRCGRSLDLPETVT